MAAVPAPAQPQTQYTDLTDRDRGLFENSSVSPPTLSRSSPQLPAPFSPATVTDA
jgi:hypothetical protein